MASGNRATPSAPQDGDSRRPAWMAVDLDALRRNVERVRARVEPASVMGVIKSDAYGHGAGECARAMLEAGIEVFGVAFADEAAALREAGIDTDVLVLGPARCPEFETYLSLRLTPTLSAFEQVESWSAWGEELSRREGQRTIPVHLKVDTGMHRLGLQPAEFGAALEKIRNAPGLFLEGVMSHLAEGEVPEAEANHSQMQAFEDLLGLLTSEERATVTVHLANSGGALYHSGSRHGMVRAGLALYGVDPANRSSDLEPVMSVGAELVDVRDVSAGERVGYGGTWTSHRQSRLGVVPIGYADGYPWRLGSRGEALVGGRRVPVVGRVSMDLTLVDVTDLPVTVGEPCVVLGRQGDEEISAWEIAGWADTLPWEILCGFGLRLPRRYLTSQDRGR